MEQGLFWLNDRQWKVLRRYLPQGFDWSQAEEADDRRIISGVIHVLQSGGRWRDCPREYGPHTTIYNRFNRWSKRGRWRKLFEALAPESPVKPMHCANAGPPSTLNGVMSDGRCQKFIVGQLSSRGAGPDAQRRRSSHNYLHFLTIAEAAGLIVRPLPRELDPMPAPP